MKHLLFFLIITSCSIEQVQPECHIASLVINQDHARLVFDDYVTGSVYFHIETTYGLTPGYWTPDQFGCIGWDLDEIEHRLILTYEGCEQEVIIPRFVNN